MKDFSDNDIGSLSMLFAMAIAGTIGYFVVESEQNPMNVVFFRCSIGGLGLVLYTASRGYFKGISLNSGHMLKLLAGGLTLVFNWYFLFSAYKLTSIGVTTVIYHLQPFFLLISSAIFLREKITMSSLVWLLLAFCGLLLIVQPESGQMTTSYIWGCLSALAAAVLYATTTLFTRSLSSGIRPEAIASCHMLIGTLVFAFLADFSQLPKTGHQVWSVVTLGLFHTTFMYVLLYTAFKKASTESLAILGFAYPLVALVVDYFAFDILITPVQCIGTGLILLAGLAHNRRINPASFKWKLNSKKT